MSPARVVLVDDDASIRRLVAMALEDLPIELVACANGTEALEALRQAPAALLITDLMMPGMSGLELLQRLADEPALRGGARLAVFSAGLNAKSQMQLADLGVWRELAKPVSVLVLAALVEEAIAPAGQAGSGARQSVADASCESLPVRVAEAQPDEADAIRTHFAGNVGLFRAFQAGCAVQFQDDLGQLQAAVDRHDAGALRRLGHSLKSVLRTLGHAGAAERAHALERAAASGDWPACRTHGVELRAALEPLARSATNVR